MRNLYSFLIIAIFGVVTAFGQGDDCITATPLGTLPPPAACPSESGTVVNVAGTTVGATAASPYVYLVNCLGAPGTGDDMDAPAADVWYSFTASGTVLDVAITSSMSQMNVALWTGTCASLSGAFCDVSASGNLTTSFEPLTPGTTYYMQISGGSTTDVGAFNMTLENYFNCNICMLQSSLTATPPPTNGYYAPGTTVTFCLTIDEWDNISNNWLHGVIPSFGDAWDLTTLNGVSSPTSCSAQGNEYAWQWYNSNTSNATGLVTGEGWYVDLNPSGPATFDGNAGNNFGDPCSIGTGLAAEFCWSIATTPICTGNYDLGMSINTTADGESGSWSSLACTGDPSPAFSAALLCCASIVNAGSDQTICSNGSTSLSGSYSNTTGAVSYVWTASPAGALAGLSSTTSLTPTFSPPVGITGPVTFTLAVTDEACTQYDDVIINVTALPTASISYAGPYCSSVATAQSVTLTGTGGYTGGTYSASPAGLTINTSSGAITPSTSTPGTYTVTYTIAAAGGCPVVTTTTSVTITPSPTATIDYADPFCTSNTGPAAVTISGTGAYTGGTYSAGAGLTINSGNGNITPSTSTAGSYTVTYTIPASGGCPAIPVTTPVVISLLPTASISYAGPYCTSVATAQSVTLTGTGPYTGGTYSASPAGLSINTSSGAITPSTSTAGTYTVTYAVPSNGGCPSFNVTASVTITAAPTATIDYADPFCTSNAGPATVTLSGTGAYTGGTYSAGAGLTINSGNGNITPSTSTAGSYTVTYTIPASGGCPAIPVTTPVVISLLPTASISYAGPYCTSVATAQSVTLTGTGPYTGGTYSASPAGLSINTSSGAITPSTSTAGTYTVTYAVPSNGGCPSFNVTASVTITAAPTATIDYADPFCTSNAGPATVTLSGTGAYTGGTYSAGAGLTINSGNGNITPSTSTAGSYTVTYTIPASGGCPAIPVTTPVVISLLPTASISYAGPYCTSVATAQSVTLTGTGPYTGGTYSASPAGLSINTSSGAITPSTSTAGTYTVTYAVPSNGGCPSFNVTASVTITAAPTATIDYADPFCTSNVGPAVVTIAGTGAYTGGTYSAGAGLTINSGNGNITPSTSAAGSYTVTYTIPASGGCPAIPVTTPVVISLLPTASIDYADPFCTSVTSAQGVTLTGTGAFSGGTYSSTAGLTINSANGSITPSSSTAGTYTVTYAVPANGGCPSFDVTTSVVIDPVPVFTVTGSSPTVCNGSDGSLLISGLDPSTNYNVTYNDDGSPIGPSVMTTNGSGEIQITGLNAGSYDNFVISYVSTGCPTTDPTSISLINPGAPDVFDIANQILCDVGYQLPAITGTGLQNPGYFSGPNGTGTQYFENDIISASTLIYIYDEFGACTDQENFTITINTTPTGSITYTSPWCEDNTNAQTVTLTGTDAYTGGSYASTAGLTINSFSGEILPSTSTPGIYVVTYTIPASGGCSAVDVTTNVAITELPTAVIDYADPFCTTDATVQVVTASGTAAWTGGAYSAGAGLSIDPVSGDIDASTSSAGVYTVTYTVPASGGCSSVPTTTSVTITQGPTAAIDFTDPFCTDFAGAISVSLTGTGAYTGGTYASAAGLTLNASSGDITPSTSTAGSYTVTYTVPASGGCPPLDVTTPVIITELPTAMIDYADPFCTTDATVQVVTASGTAAWTGGTYSAGAGLTIDPVSGDINASTSTAGTYTVTYIVPASGGCSAVPATTSVTITQGPTAAIDYTDPFCTDYAGAASVSLTGTGAYTGGTYASAAGLTLNASSGDITPSTSTAGSYTVTYTVPASGGCPPLDVTTPVIITELPTAMIDYADPFCTTDATVQVVTASGTAAWTGGTYSAGAGLTIDPVSGDIDASTSSAGVYTVTYTVPASGGCSAVPATTSVTITQGPTAAIDYTDPFCTDYAGAASVSLTGTGAYTGGTYASAVGLTLNASSGDITPSTSTAGSYTVTYTVPASGGCPPLDVTTPVTITELPTAMIDYADPFCTTEATVQVVTASGTAAWTGGTYSAGAGLTIDLVSGDINASTSSAGVYTVTYTVPASGGCPAVPVTTGVTVTEAPTASISYNTPYCESFVGTDAVTLTGTAAYAGGSFSAGAGLTINAASGVIEPSTSVPGSYTVTYSIPASGGCASTDVTAPVVINPTPVFTLGSTDPTTCDGSDGTITISGLNVSTTYSVSYDDDNINSGVLSLTSDGSGDIVITGLDAGTYDNFSLTLNGCPGTSASVINLNNPGAPILTNPGAQVVCDTYALPAISGTALTGNESYWTGPGATGTQLAVGSAITSSQTVYMYDVNGLCSDEESFVVTVNITPTLSNPGDQVACDSYTLGTITGLNLSGSEAYYDDSQANGAVQISGNITSAQTVWIYDAQGACFDETSFVVTINTTPSIINPGDQQACDSYSLGAITGTNLSGNEAYFGDSQANGGVQITGPITASQTVYIYDNIGTCSDEQSFVVTINNTPVITNPGDQLACANLSLGAIIGTNLSGSEAYYNNTQSNGGVQISGAVTSTQTVYLFDSNGDCTDEQSFLVTINPLPTVTAVTGGGTFCEGDPVTGVSVNVTGSPVWIVTYSVDGGTAQTATGSTSPILLGIAAGVYDILDIEDANCINSASGTGTIVINNCEFTIPTAITPNADGVHDDWELYGLDAAYPNNVVRIYNRWGGLLYEHDSSVDGAYDSNRWKGDYNGEALPVGSYYYIIELKDEDKKVESGAVSILLEK